MARFTSVPAIPTSDIDVWEQRFLNALRQNIELLTATRSEPDRASKAVLSIRSNFPYPEPLRLTNFQAVTQYQTPQIFVVTDSFGSGIGGGTVLGILENDGAKSIFDLNIPTGTNLLAYAQDVTALSAEVASINATLDNLIQALKGRA